MNLRTVLLIVSNVLCTAGQVMFVVGFSLKRWTQFDNGDAGLWTYCDQVDCISLKLFSNVAFLEATRVVGCLTLVAFAIAVFADCFNMLQPNSSGATGYVVKYRLKEAAFLIAGFLALLTGTIYSSSQKYHYTEFNPVLGTSIILVFVSSGVTILGAIIMYKAKRTQIHDKTQIIWG